MNIRGWKSKIRDIASIAEDEKLDVMVFTETKLKKKETRKLPGYKDEVLNRETEAGGVIVYIKEDIQAKVIIKNKDCETIWIKISDKKNGNLIIGGTYSPCEFIIPKSKIIEFVKEMERDYKEIKRNTGNKILLVGDLNAHVGNDEYGIKGNHETVGPNGEQYRKFINNNNLNLMNNTDRCKGKWTRIKGDNKSILDLTITTEELKDKIEMEIGEEGKRCIESKRAQADHRMTILELNDIFEKKEKEWKTVTTYNKEKWTEYTNYIEEYLKQKSTKRSYREIVRTIKRASNQIKTKRRVKVDIIRDY